MTVNGWGRGAHEDHRVTVSGANRTKTRQDIDKDQAADGGEGAVNLMIPKKY